MDKTYAQEFFETGKKFHKQGNLDKALRYCYKALNYLRTYPDMKTEADVLLEVGNIYVDFDDYKIQKYYQSALEAFEKNNDNIGEGYALSGIGFIREKQERFVEARENYFEANKKFEETNDQERVATISSLIGGTYEEQGSWEDAIIEYKRSSSIFKNVK